MALTPTRKQPLDATLAALAGVTTAANKLIYATGSDAFATTDLTSFGRSLIDDDAASNARTTLGLVIGTDVAAQSSLASYLPLAGGIITGQILGSAGVDVRSTGSNGRLRSLQLGNVAGYARLEAVKATGSIAASAWAFSVSSNVGEMFLVNRSDTISGGVITAEGSETNIMTFLTGGLIGIGGTPGAMFQATSSAAGTVGTIIKGAASQTADLTQWQNSSATVLASVKADGTFVMGGTMRLMGYTVATLPAGTVGDTAYCTDLLAPTFFTLAIGGGAVVGPVFYNGGAWVTT